jgi:hypothetical protein
MCHGNADKKKNIHISRRVNTPVHFTLSERSIDRAVDPGSIKKREYSNG